MPRGKPSKGMCSDCGAEMAKPAVTKHLSACVKRQVVLEQAEQRKTASEALDPLRVEDRWRRECWLDLEVRGSRRLEVLDAYLRRI